MIVRPILGTTWREVLRSPIRVTLLVLFLVPGWLSAFFGKPSVPASGPGLLIALIVGAGLIGRPASNGTLALVLSRPVRRVSYVITRWFAIASLASALAVVNLLVTALLAHTATADWGHLGFAAAEDVLCATGAAAVLTLFSSWVGGMGDVALLAILSLVAQLLKGLGGFLSRPSLNWAGYHLGNLLLTSPLDLETLFRSTPISWHPIVAYLSTVTLCLAVATERMCRREISYAGGGD